MNASNFIKQILLDLKAQIDPNTMIMGDFSVPLYRPKKSTKKPEN
jgi:hypothetical protein